MQTTFYENINILDTAERDGFKAEILEYKSLKGSKDVQLAGNLFLARESGMSLKQIKITLNNGSVTTESGALYYMKGQIEAESKIGGVSGFLKKTIQSKLNQEATFKPTYTGTGEIFLEPSFGHYIFVELKNESIVVDKGLFFACESSLEISVSMQKNLSSGIFGNEGWFQTKISGTGLCILEIPVPRDEVIVYNLDNEKLQVDGNFALLRNGNIQFTVQRSTKNLIGTLTSGEGLLQTFEGTGQVWLAPTQSVYHKLELMGVDELQTSKNMTNQTGAPK